MPYKLLISMFASGVLLWWFAIQTKPLASNWLVIELPNAQLSPEFAKQLPEQCRNDTELVVLQYQLEPKNLAALKQALQELHDPDLDEFYQPLFDIFSAKSIGFDPLTFTHSSATDAVQIDRRVRRIGLHFGQNSIGSVFSLVYDFTVDHQGTIKLAANPHNQKATSIQLDVIQNPAYQTAVNDKPDWITDCMAAALPLLRTDLNWQLQKTPDHKNCLIFGKAADQLMLQFQTNCSPSKLSINSGHQANIR